MNNQISLFDEQTEKVAFRVGIGRISNVSANRKIGLRCWRKSWRRTER